MQMIQNLISGILFLKIFWTYNFFIFVHMFQSISGFFYFRFSSKKSQSQQKMAKKDHSFYMTVLLKKTHSFYEPQLT